MKGSGKLRERLERARLCLGAGAFDEAFALCNQPPRPSQLNDLSLLVAPPSGVPSELEAERLLLGAYALFGLEHVHQAADWVGDYGRVRPDASFLYMQALLHLHAREPDQALLKWTRILQEYPSQTLADRLIEKLRAGEAGLQRDITAQAALWEFLPPLGSKIGGDKVSPGMGASARSGQGERQAGASPWPPEPSKVPAAREILRRFAPFLLAGILLAALLGLFWASYGSRLQAWWGRPDPYAPLDRTLPGPPEGGSVTPAELMEGGPAPVVYASRDEVASDMRQARSLIVEGHPNQARLLLARIEFSNASFELKERARLLRDMIPTVAQEDFRDPLSRAEAAAHAQAYRGGDVLWQGRVARVARLPRPGFLLEAAQKSPPVVVELPGEGALAPTPGPGQLWEVYGTFMGRDERGRLAVRARRLRLVPMDEGGAAAEGGLPGQR